MLSDATPIALTGHSRNRGEYAPLIDQALNGMTNYSWTERGGPDVYFGGGADQFLPGDESYQGKSYYDEFAKEGYSISLNKTSLLKLSNEEKALGVFSQGHMPVWLDRNIYKDNLKNFKNDPRGGNGPALDLPGLKDMTLKAVEILNKRGGDEGFFLMSEAASVDKQMHALDYDRALGDLLELDDTVRATIEKLKELDILEDTLVIVSADHGHGFDVFGSADTKYLEAQEDSRHKRRAVGVYERSGHSQYTKNVEGIAYGTGANFPVNWEPRYAIAAGMGAMPDHRENYKVHKEGPRVAAVEVGDEHYVNPKDAMTGFVVNGTIDTTQSQGVHSLTDVPLFAWGPCQETFSGTYNNIDIFYKIANCLGLGTDKKEKGGCKPGNKQPKC